MSVADWIHKMRSAGLDPDVAEAIASMPETRYVTREYLDARLEALEHRLEAKLEGINTRLMVAVLGGTGLILGSIYFVLPRLVTVH